MISIARPRPHQRHPRLAAPPHALLGALRLSLRQGRPHLDVLAHRRQEAHDGRGRQDPRREQRRPQPARARHGAVRHPGRPALRRQPRSRHRQQAHLPARRPSPRAVRDRRARALLRRVRRHRARRQRRRWRARHRLLHPHLPPRRVRAHPHRARRLHRLERALPDGDLGGDGCIVGMGAVVGEADRDDRRAHRRRARQGRSPRTPTTTRRPRSRCRRRPYFDGERVVHPPAN